MPERSQVHKNVLDSAIGLYVWCDSILTASNDYTDCIHILILSSQRLFFAFE